MNLMSSIVEKAAAAAGVSLDTAGALLGALKETLRDAADSRQEVAIPRFGTFKGVFEPERVDRDLASGKMVMLPPSVNLSFRESGALRSAVRNARNPKK